MTKSELNFIVFLVITVFFAVIVIGLIIYMLKTIKKTSSPKEKIIVKEQNKNVFNVNSNSLSFKEADDLIIENPIEKEIPIVDFFDEEDNFIKENHNIEIKEKKSFKDFRKIKR